MTDHSTSHDDPRRSHRAPAPDPAKGDGAEIVVHPAGHTGRLTTPSGAEVPVRTFERGDGVALVVLVDIEEQLANERLDDATLEYNSVRGLVRLHGEAIVEDRSLIRFRALDDAEILQRREFVRVTTPRPVTLKTDVEMHDKRAHTVDLSGGGMLLAGVDALDLGDTVRFSMDVGLGQAPIEGQARVVRIDGDGKRALSFEQINEADRQRLIRFVFECMRTARARTRGDWL